MYLCFCLIERMISLNSIYKKATIDDIVLLIKTRIEVLRAANNLTSDIDMDEIKEKAKKAAGEAAKVGKEVAKEAVKAGKEAARVGKEVAKAAVAGIKAGVAEGRKAYEENKKN